MKIENLFGGSEKDIAALGLKKTKISLALNKMGLKKSGKGGKGNTYFNRTDYIIPLIEQLEKFNCFISFWMEEESASFFFCDAENGAYIQICMPWSRVNIETKYNKSVLDAMQEIGAGGTYVKRYLEVYFFDLAEEDVLDMPNQKSTKDIANIANIADSVVDDNYIYTKDNKKLFNPPCICKEENKIKRMFAWAGTEINGFPYDPDKLIKQAIRLMLRNGIVKSDSKKEFPLEYMGALSVLIEKIKIFWSKKMEGKK